MTKVTITHATPLDVAAIYKVELACFDDPWHYQTLVSDVVENPLTDYYVAKDDGTLIGFGGMYDVLGEAHITNIAVLPAHRKQGIAGQMLLVMIKNAKKRGCQAITLEVRASNKAAIALYTRYGFKPEGVRPKYYQNNGEDALIMWLNFYGSRSF